MKKLLLLFVAMLCSFAVSVAEDVTVVYDFTTAESLMAMGIDTPAVNAGTNIAAMKIKKGDVELTATDGSNATRVFKSTGSGNPMDLRVYASGGSLTFTVPGSKVIKEFSWTTANEKSINSWTVSSGNIANGKWAGDPVCSITLSATATVRVDAVTIKYGDAESPQGDVLTASLDFTKEENLATYGIAKPGAGEGTALTSPIVQGDLTFSFVNAEGVTPVRAFATKSGVLDLRIYEGDAICYSVPDGYGITKIQWTTANSETIDAYTPSSGSVNTGVWTGEATEKVTLTATGTTRINTVTVSYEKLSGTCATPTIEVAAGKVTLSCATSGVKYHYSYSIEGGESDGEISVPSSITLNVYATKTNMEKSAVATKVINVGEIGLEGDLNGDQKINVGDLTLLVYKIMKAAEN